MCSRIYSFVHRILTVAAVQETFLLSGCTNTYKTLGGGGEGGGNEGVIVVRVCDPNF